jgi:hypothetical protein
MRNLFGEEKWASIGKLYFLQAFQEYQVCPILIPNSYRITKDLEWDKNDIFLYFIGRATWLTVPKG